MDANQHPKTALTWAPEGKGRRGRPVETWRRTAERERTALGFTSWSEAAVAARDQMSPGKEFSVHFRKKFLEEEKKKNFPKEFPVYIDPNKNCSSPTKNRFGLQWKIIKPLSLEPF